ncbi:hypothetical protein [Rhodococcus baikonurensis]|uniref:Uncharacterized protein n=1 Tax=Rhodococcus baikonurensis TaxID=172041 RepID=A0ABV5X6Y0_9NOCA
MVAISLDAEKDLPSWPLVGKRIVDKRENRSAQSRFDPQDHRLSSPGLAHVDSNARFLSMIGHTVTDLLTHCRHVHSIPGLSAVVH